jgi:hypothetical protein
MRGLLPHPTLVDTAERARFVDEVIQCYVAWREQCDAVRMGYESWCSGAGQERTIRFALYKMAVDREESAAKLYADSIGRLRRFLWPQLEP